MPPRLTDQLETRDFSGTPTRDRSHVPRRPIGSGCRVELEQLREAGRGARGRWIRVMLKRLDGGSVRRPEGARAILRLDWKELMNHGEHRRRGPGPGADPLGRIQPSAGGLVCLRGGRGGQTEHEKQHCQWQGQSPVPGSDRAHHELVKERIKLDHQVKPATRLRHVWHCWSPRPLPWLWNHSDVRLRAFQPSGVHATAHDSLSGRVVAQTLGPEEEAPLGDDYIARAVPSTPQPARSKNAAITNTRFLSEISMSQLIIGADPLAAQLVTDRNWRIEDDVALRYRTRLENLPCGSRVRPRNSPSTDGPPPQQ